MRQDLAAISFADLRARLKARADEINHTGDLDLHEVLDYLVALPDSVHTSDSVGALIELARSLFYASKSAETLRAASTATRLAIMLGDDVLLSHARGKEAAARIDVGQLGDATVALADAWSAARACGDKEKEMFAIWGGGEICGAMGQWNAAIPYFERARELATELGSAAYEIGATNNLAECALQLREPRIGLDALAPLLTDVIHTRTEAVNYGHAHISLARLHLLLGDVGAAQASAKIGASLTAMSGNERQLHRAEAVQGLIDVKSGAVEAGLSAIRRTLTFARRADHSSVADYLGMCVDGYEYAGRPEDALQYLQELVAWKKKSVEVDLAPLQFDELEQSIQFEKGKSLYDSGVLARDHSLRTDVLERLQRLVETAINAEIAAGHDLYRTFRLARLARQLATKLGWTDERAAQLVLGARLCHIGMMAIPARILQKPVGLSVGEREVLRDHTRYGGELLRGGYPCGLDGESILEEARVVAICDAFDAMTKRRPWRTNPLSVHQALDELKRGAGSQFDPRLVQAFVELIQHEHSQSDDFDAFLAEGADDFEYVHARARMDALLVSTTS